MQFPLRLATSDVAAGPFALQPATVKLDHDPQDMNTMLDTDGRTYIIYTSAGDYRIRVQRLTANGTQGEPGASSAPFGPNPCEAPVLFRRDDAYFAIFGHNWCVRLARQSPDHPRKSRARASENAHRRRAVMLSRCDSICARLVHTVGAARRAQKPLSFAPPRLSDRTLHWATSMYEQTAANG